MLADVMREREKERILELEKQRSIYNKPYKRDTIIYFNTIHTIGGIETWIYTLGKKYDFSVVYDKADKKQLERLNSIGIETILNVGQEIECNTLLLMLWDNNANIKAKKRYLFIHGIYNNSQEVGEIPEHDEVYAVSKVSAESFEKITGIKTKVMYNPIDIEEQDKPLIIGVFSRLSKEKGKERIKYIADRLIEKNKEFLMLIFTDIPFEYNDSRVVFMKPTLNNIEWMKKCDYILNPSDTEAGSYTLQEALKIGKPLIVTRLPILEEFGINESNAKILKFDMSNLDIEDLWNIPKINKWQEPISKEWEEIMKKRVFRERKQVVEEKVEEIKPVKKTAAKNTKKSDK
jgi:glycosyltransferase involved in cell wall biosynthesis